MSIQIGQEVTWSSQAGSFWKTKTGKVLAIIPALGRIPDNLIPADTPNNRIKFDCDTVLFDRVVVAVPRGKGYDYYAPRLGIVERQMKEAAK